MAKKAPVPAKMGRPLKYRAEYARQTEALCLLGYSDAKLAKFFDVNEATIHRWKHDHPGFREAIRGGKDGADAHVVSALYRRATGYSHPEVDIKVVNGEIVQTKLVKHYPPDTPAAMFWLTNRQPEAWKSRREDPDEGDAVPTPVQVTVVVQDARKPGGDGADA